MCPRRKMTRAKGFINFEFVKNVIDQTSKYTSFIRLHEMGEPLLDKNICKIINYCAEKKIQTEISTNITLLSKDKISEILCSRLYKIVLCLDGVTKQTYEKIRVGSDFELTVKNIGNFLKMKKELGRKTPQVHLQIILMNETEREISKFVNEWRNSGVDDVVIKRFSTFSNQVEGIKELSELSHRYKDKTIKRRFPCFYLWDSVVVLWDGKVVPCCRDFNGKIILGDAKKDSLIKIWNGQEMQELRKRQIKGDFDNDLCRDCIEWPAEPCQKFYPVCRHFIDDLKRGIKKWQRE